CVYGRRRDVRRAVVHTAFRSRHSWGDRYRSRSLAYSVSFGMGDDVGRRWTIDVSNRIQADNPFRAHSFGIEFWCTRYIWGEHLARLADRRHSGDGHRDGAGDVCPVDYSSKLGEQRPAWNRDISEPVFEIDRTDGWRSGYGNGDDHQPG